ncbi:hypothetical protein FNT36_13770 [Hymenobacter setariae]|uniref:Uncharacterized protein n=1 Tax=Hymenobacter setariae TaxID=2594794 RepID=A0A558BVM7_9BACT|nr:hypothetical protein [Hymenobacter setariae]TVT40539.1 hypothetical protein FNT36_13770 [Hymenobacter setariae]
MAEGLYQPHLVVEGEAQQWFSQADAAVHAAADSHQLADLLTAQVLHFLARVTKAPAGAFVTRRLQEAAPYY